MVTFPPKITSLSRNKYVSEELQILLQHDRQSDKNTFHVAILVTSLCCKWKSCSCKFLHGFLWLATVECFYSVVVFLYFHFCAGSQSYFCWESCFFLVLSCLQMYSSAVLPFILCLSMQVNTRAGFRLQENNFYVPAVKRIVTYLFNMKHEVSIKS